YQGAAPSGVTTGMRPENSFFVLRRVKNTAKNDFCGCRGPVLRDSLPPFVLGCSSSLDAGTTAKKILREMQCLRSSPTSHGELL
ncbi:hypothetical protein HPB47_017835, partial [Ixodes persulcatus]